MTILFDFDGTIADSKVALQHVYNQLAKENGFKIIEEEDLEFFREKSARELIKILDIPTWKIPFLVKKGRRMLQDQIPAIKPFTGIMEALTMLEKQNIKLAILSSNSVQNIKVFLDRNHLAIFTIIDSESNLFGKALAIKKFLEKYSLQKNEVIYVGDEIRDIEAAHKIGMRIISVSWGLNSKKGLLQHHPDVLVDHPHELISVVKNFSSGRLLPGESG